MNKKIKKLVVLLIIATLFLTLGACGGGNGGEYYDDENDTPGMIQENDKEKIGNLMANSNNTLCYEFNDGFAFCRIDRINYIINENGKITGTTSYEPLSNSVYEPIFHNGTALVYSGEPEDKEEQTKYLAIDTSGNVIATPSNGEFSAILGISEKGQILVCKREESYEGVKGFIGLINNDGSWAYQLKELEPSGTYSFDGINSWEATYCGDGAFIISGNLDNDKYIYDTYTGNISKIVFEDKGGDWFKPTEKTIHHRLYNAYILNQKYSVEGLKFINGKAIALFEVHNPNFGHSNIYRIVSLSKNGKYEVINNYYTEDVSPLNLGSYNGELFFMEDGYYSVKDGLIKIDLSDKKIEYATSFVNGKAILYLLNDAGTTYITAIDETGKFLFEPINSNEASGNSDLWLKGGYSSPNDKVGLEMDKLIDGELTGEIFINHDIKRYVDKDGNILFMD